jgi:xanthine permease XanP
VVSGVVIIAVRIQLGKIGLGVVFEPAFQHDLSAGAMVFTALCVVATMTGLTIWAKGTPKLLCVLIGILLGYAMSAVLQIFPSNFGADFSAVRDLRYPIRASLPMASSRL